MISFAVLFYIFIILFAVIGAVRGWAKEILVFSSMILAMFILVVLETWVPFVKDLPKDSTTLFWVRITILGALAFFGYQTPNIGKIAGARFAREKLQDTLLGLFLGAINGYLLVGTIWAFLHDANYPFEWIIKPLPEDAANLIKYLPPQYLMKSPTIFFAAGLVFIFILVVFI
jgi:uncharacterized membrane protein required for colicin V production